MLFSASTFLPLVLLSFFFNDTATTEIYTLSLHDALPICLIRQRSRARNDAYATFLVNVAGHDSNLALAGAYDARTDRKSTRLNSSHTVISYAVFCLKKKKNKKNIYRPQKQRTIHIADHHY